MLSRWPSPIAHSLTLYTKYLGRYVYNDLQQLKSQKGGWTAKIRPCHKTTQRVFTPGFVAISTTSNVSLFQANALIHIRVFGSAGNLVETWAFIVVKECRMWKWARLAQRQGAFNASGKIKPVEPEHSEDLTSYHYQYHHCGTYLRCAYTFLSTTPPDTTY